MSWVITNLVNCFLCLDDNIDFSYIVYNDGVFI